MNTQKILIAAGAGGATLLAAGYITYILLFGDSNIGLEPAAEGVFNTTINFSGIIVMELLYGLLLATTLNWKGIDGFGTGLIPGGLIGALVGLTYGLDLFSTTDLVNFNGVIFWGLTYMIRFSVAGGVIGLVYSSHSK
jgi:hypothetical protein